MKGRRAGDDGISLIELKASLARDGRKALYAALGEDACLRDQAVDMIRRHGVPPSGAAAPAGAGRPAAGTDDGDVFSFEVLYGDETSGQDVVSRAREVGFFSGHRVILLTWADKLSAKEGDALAPYFDEPCDTTTLIVSAGHLDGRLKWVKACQAACHARATVVNCAPLYDNQRPAWIRQEAARLGLKLDADAEDLLKDVGGEGLYRVRRELEKLTLYASGATVTARDVAAVQGKEPGASVFDLSGAVARGDDAGALLILEKNLTAGEAPLQMLGALLWQYRRLWKANDGLHRGVGEAALVKSLGIRFREQRGLFDAARRTPPAHFPRIFAMFAETDRALKGAASHASRRVLHALIFGLCRLAHSASAGPRGSASRAGAGRSAVAARGPASKRVSGR